MPIANDISDGIIKRIHAIDLCVPRNLEQVKGVNTRVCSDTQVAIEVLISYRFESTLIWGCLATVTQLGTKNTVSSIKALMPKVSSHTNL